MLSRVVVEIPSLETIKDVLDGALSNLTQLKMSLLTEGELDKITFKAPLKCNACYDFYDSVIYLTCCCGDLRH